MTRQQTVSASEETALTVEDRPGGLLAVTFSAMASPCELLLLGADQAEAWELGVMVAREAWRVEQKYSRYRDDSVIARFIAIAAGKSRSMRKPARCSTSPSSATN